MPAPACACLPKYLFACPPACALPSPVPVCLPAFMRSPARPRLRPKCCSRREGSEFHSFTALHGKAEAAGRGSGLRDLVLHLGFPTGLRDCSRCLGSPLVRLHLDQNSYVQVNEYGIIFLT